MLLWHTLQSSNNMEMFIESNMYASEGLFFHTSEFIVLL